MIKTLLILTLFTGSIFADSLFVGPSVYYTNGNYNNQKLSKSLALYNVLQISRQFTLIQHYDNLLITHPDWKFKQQTFLGGAVADLLPFFLKFHYAHYMGEYNDNYSTPDLLFDYSDVTNVFNTELMHYDKGAYLGLSFTFINSNGFVNRHIQQAVLRLEKFVMPELFVSFKPAASFISGESTLFSAALKLIYYPSDHFIIKAGGFTGERLYFFDPDLLVFFNQNDVQRYLFFAQVEYVLTQNIAFIAGYNHTTFSTFKVDYLVGGIRTGFWF